MDEGAGTRIEARRGRGKNSSQTGARVRLSGAERQQQVAEAALTLIARHGLAETTLTRIAESVGMEAPSLYAHFSGRDEILLATLDVLGKKFANHHSLASNPNMLERMRELALNHPTIVDQEFDGLLVPIFEFITAPRDSGLGKAAGRVNLETLNLLTETVEEGKRQGTIRQDIDAKVAAYEWLLLYWGADITHLMGLDEFLQNGIYQKILDLFMRDIAPTAATCPPPRKADTDEASPPE